MKKTTTLTLLFAIFLYLGANVVTQIFSDGELEASPVVVPSEYPAYMTDWTLKEDEVGLPMLQPEDTYAKNLDQLLHIYGQNIRRHFEFVESVDTLLKNNCEILDHFNCGILRVRKVEAEERLKFGTTK